MISQLLSHSRYFFLSLALYVLSLSIATWLMYSWPLANVLEIFPFAGFIVAASSITSFLLCAVLLKPFKSRKALQIDYALIAVIQVCFAWIGISALAEIRPLAVVFEVDRFRVVTYADIYLIDNEQAPHWVKKWGIHQDRILGAELQMSGAPSMERLVTALSGIDIGQMPSRWRDYSKQHINVRAKAKNIKRLHAHYPELIKEIKSERKFLVKGHMAKEIFLTEETLWLPIVSRRSLEWVAFIDPASYEILGYLNVDGFID